MRTAGRIGRVAAWTSVLLAVAYAGALGYLRFNERAFVYLPESRHVARPAPEFALGEERVTYPSSDDVTLAAWIIRPGPDRPTDMWLLICHGNLGNIGYAQRPEFYAYMRDAGVNQLAFDYRGYGESTGSPDEQGLYADATASYDYLTHTRGIRSDRIVIFGHSLGSGVAIDLASRVPSAGLIVEGAYSSVVDRAAELYPYFPIRLVATQRFASIERLPSVTVPKLFLHSPEDTVIPIAHGRRLFDAARGPTRFVSVRGGHEDAFRVDRATYYGAIASFIDEAVGRR